MVSPVTGSSAVTRPTAMAASRCALAERQPSSASTGWSPNQSASRRAACSGTDARAATASCSSAAFRTGMIAGRVSTLLTAQSYPAGETAARDSQPVPEPSRPAPGPSRTLRDGAVPGSSGWVSVGLRGRSPCSYRLVGVAARAAQCCLRAVKLAEPVQCRFADAGYTAGQCLVHQLAADAFFELGGGVEHAVEHRVTVAGRQGIRVAEHAGETGGIGAQR